MRENMVGTSWLWVTRYFRRAESVGIERSMIGRSAYTDGETDGSLGCSI
jgi:hypothetical protein